MASIVSVIILLFVIITLSVLIIQHVIIPATINYEHGLLNHPDFTIEKSKVDGLGLFTKRRRLKDEKLFIAITSNKAVTKIGSKINHCPGRFKNPADARYSMLPNTYLSSTPEKDTGVWWIIAARDIRAGEELTIDYTNTPDFINKPDPKWRCDL
jgi:SET domain-containing protein